MKSGKKGIPVQKRTESGKKGQNGRNGRDDPEKTNLLFRIRKKARGKNVAALKIRRSWMASKIFLTSLNGSVPLPTWEEKESEVLPGKKENCSGSERHTVPGSLFPTWKKERKVPDL